MKGPIIALLVMIGLLWVTIVMVLTIWVLFRWGKVMEGFFHLLDSSKLARARKLSMWLIVLLAAMAAAGIVLPVLKRGFFWLLLGVFIISAAIAGGVALLVLAQLARSAAAQSSKP
jgi:hypothetical protein